MSFDQNYLARKCIETVAAMIHENGKDSNTSVESFLKHAVSEFIMSVRGEVKYGYEGQDHLPEEAYVVDKETRDKLYALVNRLLDTMNNVERG